MAVTTIYVNKRDVIIPLFRVGMRELPLEVLLQLLRIPE